MTAEKAEVAARIVRELRVEFAAAAVLADHQFLYESLDHGDHCSCDAAVASITAHQAEMLTRAGLLAPGTPPETPTTRVLAERADVTVEEAPEGDPGMEAVQAWFRNGGC